MANVTLLHYNNYFNRIVKKEASYADYLLADPTYNKTNNVNFVPGDGVTTSLVLGTISLSMDFDYLIVTEMENSVEVIKSRWFIIEENRTRDGQYEVSLKRDVLVDHYSEIMSAPCFVEKGNISSSEDPLLFNSENMTYNQIKQSEILLKDKTGCPWIIGYVSQDKTRYPESGYYENNSPISIVENYNDLPTVVKNMVTQYGTQYEGFFTASSQWVSSHTISSRALPKLEMRWRLSSTKNKHFSQENGGTHPQRFIPQGNSWYSDAQFTSNWNLEGSLGTSSTKSIDYSYIDSDYYYDNFSSLLGYLGDDEIFRATWANNFLTHPFEISNTELTQIENLDGKYVEKDNKIYQISVFISYDSQYFGTVKTGTPLGNSFVRVFNEFKTQHGSWKVFPGASDLLVSELELTYNTSPLVQQNLAVAYMNYNAVRIRFDEVTTTAGTTIKSYIPANRAQCYDTPMDIFAIPYAEELTINDSNSGVYHTNKQVALQAAMALGQAGNNLYDIQLLPYCPISEMADYITISGESITLDLEQLKTDGYVEEKNFNYIKNINNANVGVIFWSNKSTFSVDIDTDLGQTYPVDADKPLELKLSNEQDLYRLVSPNYSGLFEFSLAKSGGKIEGFNADCTYKPYNPYIHVSPNLKGLYGDNFSTLDDARGLICGGDFSVARWTSAWEQYQLNNKNYQLMFDRQIQNMDVNNQIAREQQEFAGIMGIFTGGIGAGAGGALAGAKLGGGVGAIAGGVAGLFGGTLGSALGYEKDKEWLARQQAENRSYAIDMYGYQLGNIQALPYSLAKTSALTNNNKLFPFVEYFTCTDMEKEILTNKLKYNGMTVMAISNLATYSSSSTFDRVFVKGQLIDLSSIKADSHVAETIYSEVNKGFYILQ